VLRDSFAVPAQQCFGRDDPALAQRLGKCCGDRSEQGPIVLGECRSADLAAQHGVLVAQHDDLKVLPSSRTHSQTGEQGKESVQETRHDRQ